MGRQDWALPHVGHVGAFPFVETHQHSIFFAHIANGQAGTKAIAPSRSFNRPKQIFGLELADMQQVVFQHTLLDGHLCPNMQVLHFAATTGTGMHAKVRTGRPHPLG